MKIISVEDQIIRGTIEAFLYAGYYLGINDGEETTIRHSREMHKLLKAMKSTDEDYLLVYTGTSGQEIGWVWFVYGNEDWAVISDYSVKLEHVMSKVNDAIDNYQDTL